MRILQDFPRRGNMLVATGKRSATRGKKALRMVLAHEFAAFLQIL